jgi:hypothetical protein
MVAAVSPTIRLPVVSGAIVSLVQEAPSPRYKLLSFASLRTRTVPVGVFGRFSTVGKSKGAGLGTWFEVCPQQVAMARIRIRSAFLAGHCWPL